MAAKKRTFLALERGFDTASTIHPLIPLVTRGPPRPDKPKPSIDGADVKRLVPYFRHNRHRREQVHSAQGHQGLDQRPEPTLGCCSFDLRVQPIDPLGQCLDRIDVFLDGYSGGS